MLIFSKNNHKRSNYGSRSNNSYNSYQTKDSGSSNRLSVLIDVQKWEKM